MATYNGSDKRLAHLFENGGGGGGGTTVIANPSGEATDDLEKLQVGQTIYGIPTGGGGGGSSTIDVLWTNSSPTSDFGAQTIQIAELLNYDLIGIVYKEGTSWTQNTPIQWIRCEDGSYTAVCLGSTGVANTFLARAVTISGNSLVFTQGFRPGVGYYDYYMIPYKILGVKVSSSGRGSTTLAELDDVNITNPADGQVLKYDATNDEWVNSEDTPMIHYSTDEQIVGTWVDGKTIYQITHHIVLASPTVPNSNIIVNLPTISDAKVIFNVESVVGGFYSDKSFISAYSTFSAISPSGDGQMLLVNENANSIVVRTGNDHGNFPSVSVDNRIRELWVTRKYIKES